MAGLLPATIVSGAVGAPTEPARTSKLAPGVVTSEVEPVRAYGATVVTASVVLTSLPPCSMAGATATADAAMNMSAAEKELSRRTAGTRMEARAPSPAGHANVFEMLALTATSTAVTQPISTIRPEQGIAPRTRPPSSGQPPAKAIPAAPKPPASTTTIVRTESVSSMASSASGGTKGTAKDQKR